MAAVPPKQRGSWKEFLWFVVKLVALLGGLMLFGYIIFLARRALPH